MGKKLIFLIVLAAIGGILLYGCGPADQSRTGQGGDDGQTGLTGQVIATEKTFPEDFYDQAEQGVLAHKVTDQETFESQWAYFQLGGTPPERNWEDEAVIFLGVIESGSCPYEIDSLQFNDDDSELTVRLKTDPKKACTDDATPRTFVLAVDAEQAARTEWVIVENFGGLTPKVKLHPVRSDADGAGQTEEDLPGTRPPAVFVEVGGQRYETVLGTYCWRGEKAGRCVDTVGPVELLAGKEPIPVQPGETIRIIVEGKLKPTEVSLELLKDSGGISVELKDDHFHAPLEKGVYYYTFGAWWRAEDPLHGSLGDAFYAFVIEVM